MNELLINRPTVTEVHGSYPDYPVIGYCLINGYAERISDTYPTREAAEKRVAEYVELLPQYYR
jgi:hypothetical protein